MTVRRRLTAVSVLGVLAATGCTADDAGQVAAGHSHAGGGIVSMAVGDGTRVSEVGYTLTDLQVREKPRGIGEVRFRIDDHDGDPVTDYVEEQTKELHLYVVNDALTVFRHLHPTRAGDGTWSAPFDVPDAGAYRVVAEFVAKDEGGNGDHVVLGRPLALPPGDPGDTVAEDRVVGVTVSQAPNAGPNGLLRLMVRDAQRRPVNLGTYLGTYGHVTGFDTETGAMVHLHPLDAPEITEDGSELTFHADIAHAGDYRLFVQVRVDGFLHTVPVELTVGPAAGSA
ncbi:putative Heavy metal-associated domain protein [metagenome]|uniref:Putative Heavy metal-associated domain protein n=1 Tax=metagenome TaxID=256318 RepID=A0A2P2CFF5_9ZZZZ